MISTQTLAEKNENLELLHDRKGSFIQYLVFTLVVLTILIFAALTPTITTIVKVRNEIARKKELNKMLEDKIQQMDLLDSQYIANQTTFDDMQLVFPAGENYSLLLADINRSVLNNGFTLNSIAFADANSKKRFTVLSPKSITLQITGDPSRIFILLDELQDYPQALEVTGYSQSIPTVGTTKSTDEDGIVSGPLDQTTKASFTIDLRFFSPNRTNFYE